MHAREWSASLPDQQIMGQEANPQSGNFRCCKVQFSDTATGVFRAEPGLQEKSVRAAHALRVRSARELATRMP
jgi:hypothetical protein